MLYEVCLGHLLAESAKNRFYKDHTTVDVREIMTYADKGCFECKDYTACAEYDPLDTVGVLAIQNLHYTLYTKGLNNIKN